MPTQPSVLAVCINWNGEDVLAGTLRSLQQSHYPALRIVVVDNASVDDSLAKVPASIPVFRLHENVGYGAAANRVIGPLVSTEAPADGWSQSAAPGNEGEFLWGYSPPDYFLILNNDLVLEPDAIENLLTFATARGPGIFGPKVLSDRDPNRLDAAWGHLTWSHVLCHFRGKNAADKIRWNQSRRVELLLGCSLLIHREVFKSVGLFDERFFMYHEEIDFLYRARQSDVPIYYCPVARVRHRGSHSTRERPLQKIFWVRRNAALFLRKHGPGLGRWSYFFFTLSLSLIYNTILLRSDRTRTILEGVREGMKVPL